MGQFSKVLLAIDNVHTSPQKAMDCKPGLGRLKHVLVRLVYKFQNQLWKRCVSNIKTLSRVKIKLLSRWYTYRPAFPFIIRITSQATAFLLEYIKFQFSRPAHHPLCTHPGTSLPSSTLSQKYILKKKRNKK